MRDASDPDRLRFSREVRIGELIAALALISTIAGTYIELRLRPLELALAQAVRDSDRRDTDAAEYKREIKADLGRVEAKLDRLIEALSVRVPR